MDTINQRLKYVREYYNLTQSEFGKRIDVGQTYLSQLEKGDRIVTEKIIKLVCFEFHISYAWLTNGEGDMKTNDDSSAAIKDKIDIILEGESDFHKTLIKSIVDMDQDMIDMIEKLVKKLYEKSQK